MALLLGSSERLLPLAVEYMHWFAPFLPFSALLSSGMFFIRLDGSPNYAMLCNAVPAVINIVLDYVFIFILGWGMTGAALATSLGYIVGAGMILGYLGRRRNVVRLCRVKTSRKSMRLTLRNVGYMCRLGLSTFLCEGARELSRSLCPLYYKGASSPRGTARLGQRPARAGSRSAAPGSGSVPRRSRRAARP